MGGDETTGRACLRWLRLATVALLGALALPAGAAPEPFLLATDMDESKPMGRWYRHVYGEAFRRMGIPLKLVVVPTVRLSAVTDQGEVHGQATRIHAYADSHPDQVRVEEPVHETRLVLYAYGPEPASGDPHRLEDLAAGKWLVEYRRGVAIVEKLLKPAVPAERLSDVTSIAQGLKKLKAGRTDLYCDLDIAVHNELLTAEFRGIVGFRKALDLGVGLPLYPYLHKSRADLAPRLAEVLRKMKAEGLIERYLRESEREQEPAR